MEDGNRKAAMPDYDHPDRPVRKGHCAGPLRLRATLAAWVLVCVVLLFGTANAEQQMYVSVESGLTLLEDAQDGSSFDFNEGYNASGSLGVKLGTLRVEGEVAYRESNISQATVNGTTFGASGDVSALSFMGNVYHDFENKSAWTPYVGGGIGAAQISFSDVLASTALRVDDDDLVLAYKFEAGFALELDDNLDLYANYNYFATTDPEFTNSVTLTKFQTGYKSHNLGFGLSFRF